MKKTITFVLAVLLMMSAIPQSTIALSSRASIKPGKNIAYSARENTAQTKENYLVYEDFEGSQPAQNWSTIDLDGDGQAWGFANKSDGFDIYSGNRCVGSMSYSFETQSGISPDNWLLTPAFIPDATSKINWHVKASDLDNPNDNYGVYVITTDCTDVRDADQIFYATSTPTWAEYSKSLSAYAGQPIKVAFRHFDTYGQFMILLDLITVTGAGNTNPTPPPTQQPPTEEITDPSRCILFEDFEATPQDWTVYDADGDGENWIVATKSQAPNIKTYHGNGTALSMSYMNDYGPLTPDNWLFSPNFTPKAGSQLVWHVIGQDPEYSREHYGVFVVDYANDEAVEVYNGYSTGEWAAVSVDLTEFAGKEIYLGFRHYESTDQFWLNLDLITVSDPEAPAPDPITHVTGVELDKTEITMKVNEQVTLKANVMPANATNKNVVWTSSDETIARVENGKVTAIAEGEVTITVTTVDGFFTAECIVKVEKAEDEPTPEPPAVKIADVNGDGEVNTADAVAILRHCADLNKLDVNQMIAADVNGDENVNTADAVAILRYAAGLDQLPQ